MRERMPHLDELQHPFTALREPNPALPAKRPYVHPSKLTQKEKGGQHAV